MMSTGWGIKSQYIVFVGRREFKLSTIHFLLQGWDGGIDFYAWFLDKSVRGTELGNAKLV